MANYVAWLHSDANYTYTGPSRFGRMTPQENSVLQLGYLVRNEQAEKQRKHGPGGRRKYSRPKSSTKERMNDYQRKIEQANQQGVTA